MTFLVIVKTSEIIQLLASHTSLSEMLIYFSEGGVGAIVVSFKLGLEFFSKESNKFGLFNGPISIKLDKDGFERR